MGLPEGFEFVLHRFDTRSQVQGCPRGTGAQKRGTERGVVTEAAFCFLAQRDDRGETVGDVGRDASDVAGAGDGEEFEQVLDAGARVDEAFVGGIERRKGRGVLVACGDVRLVMTVRVDGPGEFEEPSLDRFGIEPGSVRQAEGAKMIRH